MKKKTKKNSASVGDYEALLRLKHHYKEQIADKEDFTKQAFNLTRSLGQMLLQRLLGNPEDADADVETKLNRRKKKRSRIITGIVIGLSLTAGFFISQKINRYFNAS